MTKITFIGAGSFGFTRGLVRDVLTFPLLKDAEICLMDIDAERLDFALKSVPENRRPGQVPRQSLRDHGSSGSPERRGFCYGHDSGGRDRSLAARYGNPQEIRG